MCEDNSYLFMFFKNPIIIFMIIPVLFTDTLSSDHFNPHQIDTASLNFIRKTSPAFSKTRNGDTAKHINRYFSDYGLNFNCNDHYFGYFKSGDYSIAGHLISAPECSTGMTAVFVHGYYDHCAYFRNLIKACLAQGVNAAAFDLPGHGLSSGKRAAVNDFSEYADALDDFLNVIKKSSSLDSVVLIGHSTGCAAIYEYLVRREKTPQNPPLFIAPLIRSRYWHISRIGEALAYPWFKTGPRRNVKASSDSLFNAFKSSDPLQYDRFPVKWAHAYFDWYKRLESYPLMKTAPVIVQGDRDDVVEWKYNMKYFRQNTVNPEIHIIKGARHHLHNETENIRKRVVHILKKLLVENK